MSSSSMSFGNVCQVLWWRGDFGPIWRVGPILDLVGLIWVYCKTQVFVESTTFLVETINCFSWNGWLRPNPVPLGDWAENRVIQPSISTALCSVLWAVDGLDGWLEGEPTTPTTVGYRIKDRGEKREREWGVQAGKVPYQPAAAGNKRNTTVMIVTERERGEMERKKRF